jgi:hypothetical protein
MRAVEDGFSLVRSARRGLLTVADNRGRIVAETASNAAPFSRLLTTVPAGHNGTLFLLLGDWFGWGAIALLLFVLVGSAALEHLTKPASLCETAVAAIGPATFRQVADSNHWDSPAAEQPNQKGE